MINCCGDKTLTEENLLLNTTHVFNFEEHKSNENEKLLTNIIPSRRINSKSIYSKVAEDMLKVFRKLQNHTLLVTY